MLLLTLYNTQGKQLVQKAMDVLASVANKYTLIVLDKPIKWHKGDTLNMSITTMGCSSGNAQTIYFSNTVTI